MKKPPYQGREIVAIEKVAEPQSESDIQESLRTVIERLGGLGKFVKPGQSVVIKPNLVSEHGLKDGVKRGGIVTDIRVVRAMVELLLPVAGTITIAEGASINRSETMKMFNHYGFAALKELSPEKVRLVDLNADECVEKNIPDGRRLQKRKIPKTLVDADVIINMPVLKLHFAAGASLSIKNLQGAIPPLEKYKVHFYRSVAEFDQYLQGHHAGPHYCRRPFWPGRLWPRFWFTEKDGCVDWWNKPCCR